MISSDTDPVVMVLIILAVAFMLLAWLASSQNSRKTRELIADLKKHEKSYWQSLPWLSRNFNAVGIIEAYRRSGKSIDPAFLNPYQAGKRSSLVQILAITMALILIAVVLIGTSHWGWRW